MRKLYPLKINFLNNYIDGNNNYCCQFQVIEQWFYCSNFYKNSSRFCFNLKEYLFDNDVNLKDYISSSNKLREARRQFYRKNLISEKDSVLYWYLFGVKDVFLISYIHPIFTYKEFYNDSYSLGRISLFLYVRGNNFFNDLHLAMIKSLIRSEFSLDQLKRLLEVVVSAYNKSIYLHYGPNWINQTFDVVNNQHEK